MANDPTTQRTKSVRLFVYRKQWKDYRYMFGMGFLLHLFMSLKELSFGRRKYFVWLGKNRDWK